MKTLGEEIDKMRTKARFSSMAALGRAIGVDGVTIWRYVKNHRIPRDSRIDEIAEACGRSPRKLKLAAKRARQKVAS